MDRFVHLRFANYLRKYAVLILACSWSVGLILGIQVAKGVPGDFLSWNCTVQNVSLPGALIVALFPIVVSVLLMYMGQFWLIPVVAFLKSFSFAYVSWILMREFGSACWLIQFLVMFSDCISLPLLWWFWCHMMKSAQNAPISLSVPMGLMLIAIVVLNHRFILPILSSLQIS